MSQARVTPSGVDLVSTVFGDEPKKAISGGDRFCEMLFD
ncbi:hypothetical protein VDG1235_86 [Verrucomicrobiia bacterium DG1235]|nr:hypothetical protein VDG1235_86 [Verrucomicrobiae bacterium DG1235]